LLNFFRNGGTLVDIANDVCPRKTNQKKKINASPLSMMLTVRGNRDFHKRFPLILRCSFNNLKEKYDVNLIATLKKERTIYQQKRRLKISKTFSARRCKHEPPQQQDRKRE